ncbi:hypothetical protein CRUP_015439 [Coryphaenoides rupestris]|nr:hypothetical protein CRUP_015439 [Coryphaenoides rupestris]
MEGRVWVNMRLAVRVSLLVILALNTAFAAEESCEGRCRTFNAQRRCQCDSMCVYHRSCCHDFQMVCRRKTNTMGVAVTNTTTAAPNPTVTHITTTAPAPTTRGPTSRGPTSASDSDAVPCSGQPFDAFLQLKNGSIYAFRGDQYHQYEFKHQPSHKECVTMTQSSPSMMFTHYINLYYDQLLEELFAQLFEGHFHGQNRGPRSISRDWLGIKPPIDAAIVGRLYSVPRPQQLPPRPVQRGGEGSSASGGAGGAAREAVKAAHSHTIWRTSSASDYSEDYGGDDDYNHNGATHAVPGLASVPVQSVYFFKSDKYYRLNLETKRVERVTPRYPRSIAKYWLGCDVEESVDVSRAEKR